MGAQSEAHGSVSTTARRFTHCLHAHTAQTPQCKGHHGGPKTTKCKKQKKAGTLVIS